MGEDKADPFAYTVNQAADSKNEEPWEHTAK